MKKILFLAAIAVIQGTAVAMAQQIAVVSEGGSTDVYQTLQEAIEGASNGSVIYLPGGGFQILDSVKITKRLSIIGIGHKAKNENVDGNTTIAGNLFFNEGASGSSVMGCYLSGNVHIGEDGNSVNNIIIKYCNLNSVQVKNNLCVGTIVNRNYIRSTSYLGGATVAISNNVMHSIREVGGGTIGNNIITSEYSYSNYLKCALYNISNTTIAYNFVALTPHYGSGVSIERYIHSGNNCQIYGNMARGDWGDDCINIGNTDWKEIFVNPNSINSTYDYHFTEDYQQYSDCGIYGGTGFSDGALPPVPFIVAKSIPEQTDAAGNLNIKIRVKAGE